MLRAFVEFVRYVVSTFQMNHNRPPREWRTGSVEALLPRTKSDIQQRETNHAVRQDSSLPYPRVDLSSGKRPALSGIQVLTCELADTWFPALRFAAAG